MKTNNTIAKIADNISEKWCVSNSEKVPLDMFALRKGFEWGASNNREHSSYERYSDVEAFIENNDSYLLCSWLPPDGDYAILDIESICPKEIRVRLLEEFANDIVYIEKSMSGNGIHAVIKRKYEKTAKYKKYAEILVNHHCTYTCDELSLNEAMNIDIDTNMDMTDEDIEDLENLTDVYDLFKKPNTINVNNNNSATWQDYKKESQYLNGSHADLYNIMFAFEYQKTLADFDNDYSRYEFGYASALSCLIKRTAPNMIDADAKFYNMHISKKSAALLIYFVLKQKLQPRIKHDEYRNGLPWLLYTADRVVNN